MAVYVSLLRAVNVGGRNLLAMKALAELYQSLGLTEVKTVLASGNVVFRSPGRERPAALSKRLRDAIEERFGIRPELLLRTPAELRAALAANPFPAEAKADPSHLVVHFFDGKAAPGAAAALAAWDRGPERAVLKGKNLYVYFGAAMGRTKLTAAVLERTLGAPGTARNFATVGKLADLSAAL